MESFETILSAGGHANSLGRAGEVYETVKSDPSKMGELFKCIYADDAWVRMRAIDTFEKLVRYDPSLAQPYTSRLVDDLTKSEQPSIQWHLAQLFAVINLSESQTEKVILWLKDRISTRDVDWIVAVNVMKTLLHFYDEKMISRDELSDLFTIQAEHGSKTVRKKAREFLDELPVRQASD